MFLWSWFLFLFTFWTGRVAGLERGMEVSGGGVGSLSAVGCELVS